MWPDRISNPRPVALESDVLPTALCGLARVCRKLLYVYTSLLVLRAVYSCIYLLLVLRTGHGIRLYQILIAACSIISLFTGAPSQLCG